jgi:GDP-mannose pyrophosphatase NudK
MESIQITDQQILSARKFPLKYITYQKLGKDNQSKQHEAEVYYRPDAVAVLLYNDELETFLLARQFRLPSYLNGNTSGYLIETCAGLIDAGETPQQAAIREVKEELGYEISNLQPVGAVYTSAGGITEYIYLFIAAYHSSQKTGLGGGLPTEGEEIELIEIKFDEAKGMLKDCKLNDAKTVMLLQHYFLFR